MLLLNLKVTLVLGLLIFLGQYAKADMFQYDTTYCYGFRGSVYMTRLSPRLVFSSGNGQECPASLHVKSEHSLNVNEKAHVSWGLSLNVQSIGVNSENKALDLKSKKMVNIINSRLYYCKFDSKECNIFHLNDHQSTSNQVGNFIDDRIHFTSKALSFAKSGDYLVFAHVTLPGGDPQASRFDFTTYTKITVRGDNGKKSKNNGKRIWIIILCICSVLFCVLLCLCLWKKKESRRSEELHNATTIASPDNHSESSWHDHFSDRSNFAAVNDPSLHYAVTSCPIPDDSRKNYPYAQPVTHPTVHSNGYEGTTANSYAVPTAPIAPCNINYTQTSNV